MPAPLDVRAATPADIRPVADALAEAFTDDPVMAWLFGTDEARVVRVLRRYFAVEIRRHLRHPCTFTTGDHPGAACWDPPGCWKTGVRDLLPLVPVMALTVGPRIPRALRGLGRIETMHERFPSHYYLSLLGTRPSRQGEGVGSALLAPMLWRCDDEGVGAYLESSKAENIPFYERHGFRVVEELPLPDGPSLWPMWRDPRPQEAP